MINESHKLLRDKYFLPSLEKYNNFLEPQEYYVINDVCDFGTTAFRNLMIHKTEWILSLILDNHIPFLVSDVDIEFFGSIALDVNAPLNAYKDIVFQKEGSNCGGVAGVNTGFILINPNNNIFNFWKIIYDNLKNYPKDDFINEQILTNENLDKIKYKKFSQTIWNWTINKNISISQIKLHHANCASSLDEKIEKLELFRSMILNNSWSI